MADEAHRRGNHGAGGGLVWRRPGKVGLRGHRDAAHVARGGRRVGYQRQRIVGVLIGDVGIFGGEDRDAGAVARIGRGGIDQIGQIAVGRVGVLAGRCIVGEHDASGLVVSPEVVEA